MEKEGLAAAGRLCDAFAQGRIDDCFACFAPRANFIFHSMPGRRTIFSRDTGVRGRSTSVLARLSRSAVGCAKPRRWRA